MNKIVRTLACATAAIAAVSAWADLDELEDEPTDSSEAETSELADDEAALSTDDDSDKSAKPAAAKAPDGKVFHLMPLCRLIEGRCELKMPGASEWVTAEEDRFYPLGCSFRTVGADSKLTIQFGYECEAVLVGNSSFGILPAALGEQKRAVALISGKLGLKLPRTLAAGLFSVTAPGFTVYDIAGESLYSYKRTGDGDEAVVRCVTGSMAIKGRHFEIPKMTVANELKIRSSQDLLFTGLYGNSGDFIVKLDQGVVSTTDFETKEETISPSVLDWHLSPKTAVRIHRAMPSIGERMSVTVMTFDTSGELRNRCAFTEGRPEVNTGEQGAGALAEQEAARAKKAAEAADAVSEEEGDEEDDEGDADSGEEPAAEEESDSGDDDDDF
jgi:hypothetical protein